MGTTLFIGWWELRWGGGEREEGAGARVMAERGRQKGGDGLRRGRARRGKKDDEARPVKRKLAMGLAGSRSKETRERAKARTGDKTR